MRYLSLLLALTFIGGMLIFNHAMAAPSGEQLREWHLAQQQLQEDQVHAVQLNGVQIKEMKRLLNQRGYRIGSIDGGDINQETTAAIHSFQKNLGLTVTGVPNVETLNALSQSSGHDEFFGLAPEFGEPLD